MSLRPLGARAGAGAPEEPTWRVLSGRARTAKLQLEASSRYQTRRARHGQVGEKGGPPRLSSRLAGTRLAPTRTTTAARKRTGRPRRAGLQQQESNLATPSPNRPIIAKWRPVPRGPRPTCPLQTGDAAVTGGAVPG